mgnify:FL=1|jgi:hypothetical protein|tara:strand:- start:177 stop:818 length:642 start_codon:yes stop_codon:yes gene_type:complete
MAFTYTTLKQTIQDYLETTETTFVSNLPNIITQAEERILKEVQLPDFRKNVTGSLSSDNEYLSTPTDYLAIYSLAVDNSGYEYLLNKDVNFIREAYPVSTVTGVPKYYALFNESTIIVAPTPSSSFDVELHYFYRPESITVAASGTSWLGDNAENALLYGSLVESYTFLKGDADLLQLYMSQYADAVSRLKTLGEGYGTTDSYRSGAVRQGRS